MADSADVDRAGVVLGAVVAALAALFAFLQLEAAKQQLREAEKDARAREGWVSFLSLWERLQAETGRNLPKLDEN